MNLNENEDIYSSIFNLRGKWYHSAMAQIPDVRDTEFNLLFEGLNIKPGHKVLDFPSGGGYLKNYLLPGVKTVELESSQVFAKINNCKISGWDRLPLKDSDFNFIFCCAAFHHVKPEARLKFLSEAYRILKSGGILCIADMDKTAPQAKFLNEFVHNNNSLGHEGDFLTRESALRFSGNFFGITRNELIKYKWKLDKDVESSLYFLKMMFGMDKVKDDELLDYLENNLNFRQDGDGRYQIDWSLRYIFLKK